MSSQPAGRTRLDTELVRRGLARSRDQAVELVIGGRVQVDGRTTVKPAARTSPAALVEVGEGTGAEFVSRGGHKLAGALRDLASPGRSSVAEPSGRSLPGLSVPGRTCLDAGACTGGFTDVLLRHGAARVVAVDVGHHQLASVLGEHPRVVAHDGINVRNLSPDTIGGPVDLVVADLSFISLRLVLPALTAVVRPGGDLLPLVKPQFEVGRERLGRGGVVKDEGLRAQAVREVAEAAAGLGFGVAGLVRSRLPGPSGNVEFFVWLKAGSPPLSEPALAHVIRGDAREGRPL